MRDLLRTTGGERDDVMRTQFIRLESVMLDRIELFADRARVFFPRVSDALVICTVCLGSFGHALVQQGLYTVTIQSLLVLDFGIAIAFHTFDLAQIFRMCWVRPGEHLHFAIELRYPFVVNPG